MGAMENWGLVTYRTTAVLFDEGKSDNRYKNRIAYVVAHGKERELLPEFPSLSDICRLQSWLTSGLVTSSPWIGGTNSGSTRASQPGSVGWLWIISTQVIPTRSSRRCNKC